MSTSKKIVILVVFPYLGGLVAYFVFASRLSSQAKTIAAYSNPDIPAAIQATRRDPNDAAAHMSLARHYIASGPLFDTEAIVELQDVVRIEPHNREAIFMLAYKLKKSGRKDESLKLYRELGAETDVWGQAARKHLAKE